MSAIPDRLDALLTRDATAAALNEAGYPVKPKTLATMASRGGGPPYQKFSNRPLYTWGSALTWAQSRLRPVVSSTSEADAAKRNGTAAVELPRGAQQNPELPPVVGT